MKAEFLILFFCSFYAAKSEENVSREGKNIDLFLERRKPTPKPFEKEEEKTSRDGNTAAELCMTQSRNLYLLLQLGCGETRNRICITTEGIMTGKMALFTKKKVPFWLIFKNKWPIFQKRFAKNSFYGNFFVFSFYVTTFWHFSRRN